MNKKKGLKILKFPTDILEAERQVEAILFAADEPLDLKSIETRLNVKGDVPKILTSGNHKEIQNWKRIESLKRTKKKRPDLLEKAQLNSRELTFLKSIDINPNSL